MSSSHENFEVIIIRFRRWRHYYRDYLLFARGKRDTKYYSNVKKKREKQFQDRFRPFLHLFIRHILKAFWSVIECHQTGVSYFSNNIKAIYKNWCKSSLLIRASFCYSPKSLSIAYETGHNNNDGREQYFLALIIQNFNLFPLSLQWQNQATVHG